MLSAAECGLGRKWNVPCTTVYTSEGTWVTSRGATKGAAFAGAPALPLCWDPLLPLSAPSPASSVLLRCPHNDPKVGLCAFVPGVFCPVAVTGWLGTHWEDPKGVWVQGTPSSSPTLPPLQLFLPSKHSAEQTMETLPRFLPVPAWQLSPAVPSCPRGWGPAGCSAPAQSSCG